MLCFLPRFLLSTIDQWKVEGLSTVLLSTWTFNKLSLSVLLQFTSKYGLLHGFKGSRLPISRTMLRLVNNLIWYRDNSLPIRRTMLLLWFISLLSRLKSNSWNIKHKSGQWKIKMAERLVACTWNLHINILRFRFHPSQNTPGLFSWLQQQYPLR